MTSADLRSRVFRRLALAASSAYFADRRFAIFFVIVFANGVVIGPFLPFLGIFVRDELGADQTITGNYRAITAILMGITGLLGAVASDRLGPKLSLVVGLLSTAAAACVFIVASEWMLILLAILHGGGHGLVTVGGETYLVRAARARRVGAASAAYFLGSTMGSAVGAAGGGAILDATSFATLGRLMLAASLMMTAAALIWLPRIAPAQVARMGLSEMLAGYVSMLRRGYVRPFIAIELLRSIFWATAALAMPFVVATLTGSNAAAGYFAGLSLLAGMVAMLVAGPVSDRIGRKHIFTGLIASMALGSAALGLTTGQRRRFLCNGHLRHRRRLGAGGTDTRARQGHRRSRRSRPDARSEPVSHRGRHTVWSTAARAADGEPYVARFLHAGGAARHRRTGRRDALPALLASGTG